MKVLLTGGAGYIGSHCAHLLKSQGIELVVIDDLSKGDRKAVPSGVHLVEGDFADVQLLDRIFSEEKIDAVLHFAASTNVTESIKHPGKYFENNFEKTKELISCMQRNNVFRFVFSSTASVYKSANTPVREVDELAPLTPYAESKLMCETLIESIGESDPRFKFIIFRYFNVAGAEPDLSNGQRDLAANHLIKRIIDTALGRHSSFEIFGTDYQTPDGSPVRDFIHVKDLAAAHLAALSYLQNDGRSEILNCGYNQGYSVREVIAVLEKLSSDSFNVINGPRRPADIAQSIADNIKIKNVLSWEPEYDNLQFICQTALDWEKKIHPIK